MADKKSGYEISAYIERGEGGKTSARRAGRIEAHMEHAVAASRDDVHGGRATVKVNRIYDGKTVEKGDKHEV